MRYLAILAAAISLLLAGCATTLHSDVTAFHQWPAELRDKSFVFEAAPAPEDTLEYRNYLGRLRAQLAGLGFTEAADPNRAALKVALHFSTLDRPVREVEMVDPFWGPPGFWPGRYGYPFGYRRWYGHDPFMPGPYTLRETIRHEYERQLRVTISSVAGKPLYDVTVHNISGQPSTAAVMPALLASAFAGFPGQSGVPHRVDLKLE